MGKRACLRQYRSLCAFAVIAGVTWFLLFTCTGHVWAKGIYWTDYDGGRIMTTPLDGVGGAVPLITGLTNPTGIDIDAASGTLYWIDADGIHSATIDGSDSSLLADYGMANIMSMRVDAARDLAYVISGGSGGTGPRLTKVDLAASPTTTTDLFSGSNLVSYYDLALDTHYETVYWSAGSTHQIYQIDTDGSNGSPFMSADSAYPCAIDLDSAGDTVYWSDYVHDSIQGTLLSNPGSSSLLISSSAADVNALRVDPAGEDLYWIDSTTSTLTTAKTDGTGVNDILTDSSLSWRSRIALYTVPEPSSGLLLGLLGLLGLVRRRRTETG